MASSSSALMRFQSACVTCVRGGHQAALRYRDFLLDPGTLFTLASLLLLIAASIQTPDGLVNSAHAHTWLYLAAALAGKESPTSSKNVQPDADHPGFDRGFAAHLRATGAGLPVTSVGFRSSLL